MLNFIYGSPYFWDKVVLTKFISGCRMVWDLICGQEQVPHAFISQKLYSPFLFGIGIICLLAYFNTYTANIFNIYTFLHFLCVSNFPLYCLYLITAPSIVEKCKHWFTVVYYNIYTSTYIVLLVYGSV